MSAFRGATGVLLVLASSCLSQNKGGVDQRVAVPMVQKILSNADLSGSLEYWGFCDENKGWPDFPEPRHVSGHEGPALDVLKEMFADDPKMRVTQDNDGKIRMLETDVPQDLLEVKIRHLSFPADYRSGSGPMAVYFILNTPEVKGFMYHNIGRIAELGGAGMPGQGAMSGRGVVGHLNDVTVAQALDYVLKRFHGLWFYQNCQTLEGRKISIGFRENLNPVSDGSRARAK